MTEPDEALPPGAVVAPLTSSRPEHFGLRKTTAAALAFLALTLTGCTRPVDTVSASPNSPAPITSVEPIPTATEITPASQITPVTEAVPDNVKNLFEAATKNGEDIAKTSVTVEELNSLYQELFMTHEQADLSVEDIATRADEVIKELDNAHDQLNLPKLPADFKELDEDAEGSQKISYSRYQQAVEDFFGKDNYDNPVPVYFDWNNSEINDVSSVLSVASPEVIKPDKTDNTYRRTVEKRLMAAFSHIDKSLQPDAIIIGKLGTSNDGAGHTDIARVEWFQVNGVLKPVLLINTDPEASVSSYDFEKAIDHELAHVAITEILQSGLEASETTGKPDPTYELLNPAGFKYSNEARAQTEADGITEDGFTVLDAMTTRKSTVITATAEGLQDPQDDYASLFSAILGGSIMDYLESQSPEVATRYVKAKTALILARISKEHKTTAIYAQVLMKADKLTDYANKRLSSLYTLNPNDPNAVKLSDTIRKLEEAKSSVG